MSAILPMLGMLLGMVLGFVGAMLLMRIRSRTFRKREAIPSILGKWSCQWFDDEGDLEEPKVQDTIEIQKWVRNGEFVAVGHQPQFHLTYPITGEIDPSRVVTLEYRAARYPYETNRGVVCMTLSRDGESMEGRWFGRRSSGSLSGGKVVCCRVH